MEMGGRVVAENRRDLTERAFAFAVQIVNICRLLDEKAGCTENIGKPIITLRDIHWR